MTSWQRSERTVGAERAPRRRPEAAALAVALVLVVAMVSRGLPSRLNGGARGIAGPKALGYALSALLAVSLVAVVLLAHDVRTPRSERARVPGRRRLDLRPLLVPFLFLPPIALAVALVLLFGRPGTNTGVVQPHENAPQPAHAAGSTAGGGSSPIHWIASKPG